MPGPVILAYWNSQTVRNKKVAASTLYTHKSLHVIHGAQVIPNHFGWNLTSNILTEFISDTNHVEMAIHTWGKNSIQLMRLSLCHIIINPTSYCYKEVIHYRRKVWQHGELWGLVFHPTLQVLLWRGAEGALLGNADIQPQPQLLREAVWVTAEVNNA